MPPVLAIELRTLLRCIPDHEPIMSKCPIGSNYYVDSHFEVCRVRFTYHTTNVPYIVIKRLKKLNGDCQVHISDDHHSQIQRLVRKYKLTNVNKLDTGTEAMIEFLT